MGLLAATLLAVSGAAQTAAAQTITVGTTNSTSDAPIFIADRKGYFRAEGLNVKVLGFRSASNMVVPLGADAFLFAASGLRLGN